QPRSHVDCPALHGQCQSLPCTYPLVFVGPDPFHCGPYPQFGCCA
uniref:Peptide Hact-4 n=1 Tax=Heliofungia actiniformis TaxID=75303 RepID=HACT4_HELAT|nr:RecName: Full=Peptide Hact-4 [Heliofungia actiniformis]